MRVQPIGVGRVAPVEPRPQRPDAAPREAPPHAERITLPPDVLEATRALPDPVKGDVRWYRARQTSLERPGILESLRDGAAAPAPSPAPAADGSGSLAWLTPARAAVAAYRRGAEAAAAPVAAVGVSV